MIRTGYISVWIQTEEEAGWEGEREIGFRRIPAFILGKLAAHPAYVSPNKPEVAGPRKPRKKSDKAAWSCTYTPAGLRIPININTGEEARDALHKLHRLHTTPLDDNVRTEVKSLLDIPCANTPEDCWTLGDYLCRVAWECQLKSITGLTWAPRPEYVPIHDMPPEDAFSLGVNGGVWY